MQNPPCQLVIVLDADLTNGLVLFGAIGSVGEPMKTVLYTFSTDVGTFWIRSEPADRVRLGIDNLELKPYSSPKAAAQAVAGHNTGWDVWDRSATGAFGLERWKRGSGHRSGRKHAHKKEVERLADAANGDLEANT